MNRLSRIDYFLPWPPGMGRNPVPQPRLATTSPTVRQVEQRGCRGVKRQTRYRTQSLECGCTVFWLTERPVATTKRRRP